MPSATAVRAATNGRRSGGRRVGSADPTRSLAFPSPGLPLLLVSLFDPHPSPCPSDDTARSGVSQVSEKMPWLVSTSAPSRAPASAAASTSADVAYVTVRRPPGVVPTATAWTGSRPS